LQERHPQTIATLIVSIPTVPTQITAACPALIASRNGQQPFRMVTRSVVTSEIEQHTAPKPAPNAKPGNEGLMDTRCCGGGPKFPQCEPTRRIRR
jgi:hypothetical protein